MGIRIEQSTGRLPSAMARFEEIVQNIRDGLAIFLDFDGTLTPIVKRPENARLSPDMKQTLKALSDQCLVAIISGRDLNDVRKRVGIERLFYAGSHGFDIAGPKDKHIQNQQGTEFLPVLDQVEFLLRDRLRKISGSQVERKKFSIAIHYRNVETENIPQLKNIVVQVIEDDHGLKISLGKNVYDIQPELDWHKGKAVRWLLDVLELDTDETISFYIGDDITDEDAFQDLRDHDIGIVVKGKSRNTFADYTLGSPEEVRTFLEKLTVFLNDRRLTQTFQGRMK